MSLTHPQLNDFIIDTVSYRAERSVNSRIRFLILHFTTLNFAQSMAALTGDHVSSHYVIPDFKDDSYRSAGFDDLRIFQLADESRRTWHAGQSFWAGRIFLNDSAIGVEIVNGGYAAPPQFNFPAFAPEQIQALIALCRDILARNPDIAPQHVLGHSDIAIGRKFDPGAAFPWFALYQHGIGAWYDDTTYQVFLQQFERQLPSQSVLIAQFERYGYDTRLCHSAAGFEQLVQSFQLHFRAEQYNGVIDAQTAAILFALTAKYCP